jgi:DTW domain-containing protein YfiP
MSSPASPSDVVPAEARPVCYRCHKPRVTCICARIRRVANRTAVWVAQHPRERLHPIGTARIARLGLEQVHVEVIGATAAAPPASLGHAALLYPSAEARDLRALETDERPQTLVVIDGTWSQARTMLRDNPWLGRLPRYRLSPTHESRYRLRKEPSPECTSTIEAIVEALRILEPDTADLDNLLASFDAMIDQQIALAEWHRLGPRRRSVARSHRGIPLAVFDEPDRVVAVGFEAAPAGNSPSATLAIVHLAALRVASQQTFEQLVRPPVDRFPKAQHLQQMGLNAADLHAAGDSDALHAAWQRFIRADDIVVAWNQHTLDHLDVSVGLPPRRVHLKSAYRSHAKQARGALTTLVQQLGLQRSTVSPRTVPPPTVPPLRGRAGDHVHELGAMLTHLQTTRAAPADPTS